MALIYQVISPSNNHLSYLMGTFHLLIPEFEPLLNLAEDLIAQCTKYFGEMDLTQVDPQILYLTQQNLPKPGKKLLKTLIERQPYFVKNNLSFPAYPEQTAIFNLYNELTLSLWKRKLMNGSVDEELLKIALKQNKPIGGIESFEKQIEIMNLIDFKEMEKQLINMLHHPKKFSKKMDFLLSLYLNGKIHKLSRETEKTSKSNKEVMITQRNKEFTNKIEHIIQETNNTFISFGAGHLGGKDGVIKSLKKKGYTISKLNKNISNSNRK